MHKDQFDRMRAREDRRRAAFAAARENARAMRETAQRSAEDEARAQEARAVLDGWSHVKIVRHGPYWAVGGRAPGESADESAPWSTTDADPVEAAKRLAGEARPVDVARIHRDAGVEGEARIKVRADTRRLPEPTFNTTGAGHHVKGHSLGADAEATAADPGGETHGGILIERDEIARLRLALSMEVDRRAAARIAARYPNDAADVARARDLNNLLMLGLITDAQREELDGLNARVGWARRVEEIARNVKCSLADMPAERLANFDLTEIPWPA